MNAANHLFFTLVEEQLADCQQVKLTLKGTSMRPTLQEGDVLTLSRRKEAPSVGDVVLFRYGGGHLLHRVVGCDGERYRMQGDNCYTAEEAPLGDIVAVLSAVERPDGTVVTIDSEAWRRLSHKSLCRKRWRNTAYRWLGREGRRQLRPWYFALLAILMWAPLNGLGVPLDNYIFGLRADHLLHASVYLPCALLLMDLFPRRRWLAWLCAVGIGLLTEGVQYLLPYRGYDVNDLVANTIGITLGWVVIILVRRRRRR